jgi:carboxymethylenebutenolidase
MRRHDKRLEVVVYERAEHAFFNDTRVTYDVDAARDSFVRALSFLRENVV